MRVREKLRVISRCLTWDTSWAGGNMNLDHVMQEEEQVSVRVGGEVRT